MESASNLDCELYLSGYDQARLSVAGREYAGRPVLDDALQKRLTTAALDPVQYGKYLFEALFPTDRDDLLAGYREALAIARHEERRLRLRLHVDTHAPRELHDLHWELLYDAKKKIALGRSRETALSRYLSVGEKPPRTLAEKPRILVVFSTPSNASEYRLAELDREAMRRSLTGALASLGETVSYEILKGHATLGRICSLLDEGKFHVLWLQAHGLVCRESHLAHLMLQKDDGTADVVAEESFAEIFSGERNLRLVTLLACHSGTATTADPFSGLGPAILKLGIPAVVAMRRALSLEAATLFTEHFLGALARNPCVDTAMNDARRQLHLAARDDFEWSTPTLFMRLADGLLWEPPAPTRRRPASVTEPREEMWEGLLPWIESDHLIPILGPGLNRGLLLTGEEVAEHWAGKYGYPMSCPPSLSGVSQYLEVKLGRSIPHQKLPRLLTRDLLDREQVGEQKHLLRQGLTHVIDKVSLRYFGRDESSPHRVLAELPLSTYVTTNYDSFLCAALAWRGKSPRRHACPWRRDFRDLAEIEDYDDLEGTEREPLVFHLYGNDLEPTSLVLTEDDYLDFLGVIVKDLDAKIPSGLRAKLSKSMLLFLGYNVNDLDCRVLFRGLISQLKEPERERLAVLQLDGAGADEKKKAEVRHFMEKSCENLRIHVYWGSAREFLSELRQQWRREYGDL